MTEISLSTLPQVISDLQERIALLERTAKPEAPKNGIAKYLSVDDTCQRTGYSKSTIYCKAHKKQLPYYKFGKRIFFLESDIETLIRKGYTPTREEATDDYLQATKRGGRP